METRILITDLTAMGGDRVCIAGIDQNLRNIRPVLPRPGVLRSHLFHRGRVLFRPRAVLRLQLRPSGKEEMPHVEDHDWHDSGSLLSMEYLMAESRWQRFLQKLAEDSPRPLFGAEMQSLGRQRNRIIRPGKAKHSLTTVRCGRKLTFRLREKKSGGLRHSLSFFDDRQTSYQNIPVTDLALRYWAIARFGQGDSLPSLSDWLTRQLNAAQHVYLRLGLGREYKGKFWLQVNGVYSFPDWLEGRCFADFAEAAGQGGA